MISANITRQLILSLCQTFSLSRHEAITALLTEIDGMPTVNLKNCDHFNSLECISYSFVCMYLTSDDIQWHYVIKCNNDYPNKKTSKT